MQDVPSQEPVVGVTEVPEGAAEMPRGCRPSRWLGLVGLVALCLVVYLPGFFSIPPVDRDESRFAQASRQMFESVALSAAYRDPARHGGGLAVPMVQDRPRLNKPPLIYWLQAGSAAVFTGGSPWRDEIWMYRVPSLLAAIAAVLLTWRVGLWLFDARTGRLAAAMLACCPVIVWEAHQARADMVLLACTVAAQLALWRVFAGAREGERRWRWPLVFWGAMAAGILTKGPVTPLVSGLTVIGVSAATGRWGWIWRLRPAVGVLVVAAAVGPWVWAVAEHVGWERYLATIQDEVLGRSVSAKEGHWGPPGYHLVLLPLLFWPGSLLTGLGLALAVRQGFARAKQSRDREGAGLVLPGETAERASLRERFRRSVEVRADHEPYLFLLAWIVPAWVVFELVGTKLPHYTMPMYPALAIVSARAVLAAAAGLLPGTGTRGTRIGLGIWWVLGAGLALAAAALAGTMVDDPGHRPAWWSLPLLAFVAYLLFVCAMQLLRGRLSRAQVAGLLVSVVLWPALLGGMLPRHADLWISDRLMAIVAAVDPGSSRPLAAVGYHEDSLVFLSRGRLVRLDSSGVEEWRSRAPGGLLVVPSEQADAIRYSRVGGRVAGFSYVKGKRVDLAVVEITGGEPR